MTGLLHSSLVGCLPNRKRPQLGFECRWSLIRIHYKTDAHSIMADAALGSPFDILTSSFPQDLELQSTLDSAPLRNLHLELQLQPQQEVASLARRPRPLATPASVAASALTTRPRPLAAETHSSAVLTRHLPLARPTIRLPAQGLCSRASAVAATLQQVSVRQRTSESPQEQRKLHSRLTRRRSRTATRPTAFRISSFKNHTRSSRQKSLGW